MHKPQPLNFKYANGAMWPVRPDAAERVYDAGKTYRLVEYTERSGKSHRHFFAVLRNAWDNLPEELAGRFPSPEHLRSYALIKAGFYNERHIDLATRTDAIQVASFIEPFDEFAIIVTDETLVTIYTPKSQSARSMGAKEFQASKDKVFGVLAKMLNITVDALVSNTNDPGYGNEQA